MDEADDDTAPGRSRRRVLAAAGTALGAGLAGCGGDAGRETATETDADDPDEIETDESTETPTATTTVPADDDPGDAEFPPLGNYPVEGETVTYGFTVPLSGPYSLLGEDQRQGYELAVDHLNSGGGWADAWDDLAGDGVRGRTVEAAFADTQTDPSEARQAAARLIDRDEAIVVSGGVSTAVAIAVMRLCQRERVQHMAALSHSNVTTGSECVRYSFREMHNVAMSMLGLRLALEDTLGRSGTVSVLYSDYSYGVSIREATERLFDSDVWATGETVPAPIGTRDYTSILENIPQETDVLVFGQFGLDAATALPQAREMGLAEEMTFVVPLVDRTLLEQAGSDIDGVVGTADWHWTRDERFSNVFTASYRDAYDERPSASARLAYAATMRYSAAVERAGTFYPPEVIAEMEDHGYANTGVGRARSRACDHQSLRDVYVLRGQSDSEPAPVEIVDTLDGSAVAYGCSESPADECTLGEYQ